MSDIYERYHNGLETYEDQMLHKRLAAPKRDNPNPLCMIYFQIANNELLVEKLPHNQALPFALKLHEENMNINCNVLVYCEDDLQITLRCGGE